VLTEFTKVLAAAALLSCLGIAASAVAQGTPAPWLSTPRPAPADQEFGATLHLRINPAVQGFWGEQHPPSAINGNTITFLFDTGCGWLCPPGEPTSVAYPFTMPALPAGTYVVRFANDLAVPSAVTAEFTLNVGLGGITSTALPIGGGASVLLGLCILLLGWRHWRVNNNVDERVV